MLEPVSIVKLFFDYIIVVKFQTTLELKTSTKYLESQKK